MLIRPYILRPGVAGLLVALIALSAAGADIVEQVLVKVNGEIITKTEFEQRQIALLRQLPEFANGAPNNDELKRAIEEVAPDLILNAVDDLLLIQRGKELGLAMGDQQFASIIENIKKENKIGDEVDFQAALKQEGMTMADLRRSMERQMLVSRVQQQEVADKIGVTEQEAQVYYAAHKGEFTTTSEVALREILIDVPTAAGGINVAQDEAARAKAGSVRDRLLAGEPFARVAAEVSDAPSKANGGLIGPFKRTDLSAALQKIVDLLKVGEIAEVIRVASGYQVLKLESRSAEKVKSFEAARGEIADRVSQDKLRVEREKYLDKLREQAIVTWRNDELKKAYEQALAKRKALAARTAE
ncbi:MAG: hypothetical protein EXQ48_03920 [Acidobacteria bacterium]|nr:hypothetical protein [Acidobacteriota bacterium]